MTMNRGGEPSGGEASGFVETDSMRPTPRAKGLVPSAASRHALLSKMTTSCCMPGNKPDGGWCRPRRAAGPYDPRRTSALLICLVRSKSSNMTVVATPQGIGAIVGQYRVSFV